MEFSSENVDETAISVEIIDLPVWVVDLLPANFNINIISQ